MKKNKLTTSLDSDCITNDNIIKAQIEKLEKQLKIKPSQFAFENMTSEELKPAAEMFLFMGVCPGTLKPWFVFYKNLFEKDSPHQILLTLNRLMKGTRSKQNRYFLDLAQSLFKRTMTFFFNNSENLDMLSHKAHESEYIALVNHPPHITKDDQMLPSALIPFCDLGGNMSEMGVKIDQFDVPICNSFKAKVLNDQLCYEVDLNTFSNRYKIDKELRSGFAFIMDYNEDRQVKINSDSIGNDGERNSLIKKIVESDEDQNSHIYLNTIGEFH